MSKKINYSIIAISFLAMVWYLFFVNDLSALPKAIGNISPVFLVLAVLCIMGSWFFESLTLYVISKTIGTRFTMKLALHVTMIGQFFNCITPFASGGQPAQIYYISKSGCPVSKATTSLIAKFLVYQISLIVYTTVLITLSFNFFYQNFSNFTFLIIIGYSINLIVLAFIFSLVFFTSATKKIVRFFVLFLSKIKLVKKGKAISDIVDKEVVIFSEAFKELLQHKKTVFLTFIIAIVRQTLFYLISVLIYFGFGLSGENVLFMISAQAFVLLISGFMPLPGGAGAAEGSFHMFFALFFAEGLLGVALFMWRFITYYLPMLVGFVFTTRAGGIREYKNAKKL